MFSKLGVGSRLFASAKRRESVETQTRIQQPKGFCLRTSVRLRPRRRTWRSCSGGSLTTDQQISGLLIHPQGHIAGQRTAVRYHLDLAGGRARLGTVAVISELETTVKVPAVPLNMTPVAPAGFVPNILRHRVNKFGTKRPGHHPS
jgi:hypothetical protein